MRRSMRRVCYRYPAAFLSFTSDNTASVRNDAFRFCTFLFTQKVPRPARASRAGKKIKHGCLRTVLFGCCYKHNRASPDKVCHDIH